MRCTVWKKASNEWGPCSKAHLLLRLKHVETMWQHHNDLDRGYSYFLAYHVSALYPELFIETWHPTYAAARSGHGSKYRARRICVGGLHGAASGRSFFESSG